MKTLLILLVYLIGAPILGGFLSGLDRKLSARMQGRVGPPLWQPFFDVAKLMHKENLVVRRSQNFYIVFTLIFTIFTGALFFTGNDLLLVIFALTLAGIFFVLGGYKASSPYSSVGAHRELLQMMAYEPALMFAAIGMYMATRSFYVSDIIVYKKPLVFELLGLFLAFVYILAIKFRKSPFDLSTSHHAHQEVVKGITTEFSGRALGLIELAHWYEYSFVLGFVYLFFSWNPFIGFVAVGSVYFLVILADNCFARAKWQMTLVTSWIIALTLGVTNIMVLFYRGR